MSTLVAPAIYRRFVSALAGTAVSPVLLNAHNLLLPGKHCVIIAQIAPEAQNEWFDDILVFERQFENAKRITVRKQIGNPPIEPTVIVTLLHVNATHQINKKD